MAPVGLRLALVCLLLCFFSLAAVGQHVRTFNYRGGGQGRITFDHGMHASKGYVCMDCHTRLPSTGTQLFQTQKQGRISIADHGSNSSCFACHNGAIAAAACEQCHRR
jgi:phosphate transport system substrate-binding protein